MASKPKSALVPEMYTSFFMRILELLLFFHIS